MIELRSAVFRVKEDASAACAYFHTWWGLRNVSLPKYHAAMTDLAYIDFFHTANTGFLKLTFVSLAKLFDLNVRSLGLRRLRVSLTVAGFSNEASLIEDHMATHSDLVSRIRSIRNKSVSHNEAAMTRDEVYDRYGVTPDEIRSLIAEVCDVLNTVDSRLGSPTRISDGSRNERSVLALLERLHHAQRGK